MRCEFGYCLICDKEIASKCDSCDSKRNNSEYTEVLLNWSNGSRMTTPVCITCSKGPVWKADKMQMTQAIWDAWDKSGHTYDKGIVIVD